MGLVVKGRKKGELGWAGKLQKKLSGVVLVVVGHAVAMAMAAGGDYSFFLLLGCEPRSWALY